MNVKVRFSIITLLCAALVAISGVSSCKKSNSEKTKQYLNGSLRVKNWPSYIGVGETFSVKISGVSHPKQGTEGHKLGFYYSISDISKTTDTVYRVGVNPLPVPMDNVPVDIPDFDGLDTLGTFSFVGTVYPEDNNDYYSSTVSYSITTIDAERSLPQARVDKSRPYFCDGRELEELDMCYNYIEADTLGNPYNLLWMQQNLAYLGSGRGYYNYDIMSRMFGRYYTWEEAQTACPDGWRLPTDQDWADLANTVNPQGFYTPGKNFENIAGALKMDARFNGLDMWEYWPESVITSTSTFHALPCGYCNAGAALEFKGIQEFACFWTADSVDGDDAYYRYIYTGEDDLKLGVGDKKALAISVRCVSDKKDE
ncbi:MAG: fibrobacter succinogenes major paralogous domain-containing protein [Bacteroidales bacterium]|nr:fibrobacter succinogenes major paralogous domain-containing protein [Candidatus Hennigimonas equi]